VPFVAAMALRCAVREIPAIVTNKGTSAYGLRGGGR
jgi:hypothetical protein